MSQLRVWTCLNMFEPFSSNLIQFEPSLEHYHGRLQCLNMLSICSIWNQCIQTHPNVNDRKCMPYACVIHSPTIELSSCCRWDLQDHKCPAETLAVWSCWIMLDRCATWYVLSRSLKYQCGWKCRMARLRAERRGEMTGHPETSALMQACLWIIAHVDLVFCVQPAINSKPFSPRRILPNPFNYFNIF